LTNFNDEGYCVKVMMKKGILMKHPFWLANSTLLLLVLLVIGFIFFSRPKIPPRVSFEPAEGLKPAKQEIVKIDLSKIYTNDLFGTYRQPLPPPKEPDLLKPMPQPPIPKLPSKPPSTAPKFLEPLKINLRGIIVAHDEHMNIAIIEDTQTLVAQNYKMGDMITDAQLIRILKNKIILIRSNGQQETLYVSTHDAEIEQLLLPEGNWNELIKKIAENSYEIDPEAFVDRVRNLAQFINQLNLTTVYRKGQSIGCRVGTIEKNSLGHALGLKQGDLIKTINQMPATDTKNRFEIYKNILNMKNGDSISIDLVRKNQPLLMQYKLEKIERVAPKPPAEATPTLPGIEVKSAQEIEEEKRKILEQKYRFAPTAEQLEKKEKQAMLKMSQRNARRQSRGILSNVNP
jgi:type II secretion system protein C